MVQCCHSYKIFSHSRFKERFLKSGFFQIPLKGIWKVSHSASGHSLKIRTLELNHFDKHFRNKTNGTKNISPSGSFFDKWLSVPRKHIFFLFEVWEIESFLKDTFLVFSYSCCLCSIIHSREDLVPKTDLDTKDKSVCSCVFLAISTRECLRTDQLCLSIIART